MDKEKECEHYWDFVRTEFVNETYGSTNLKEVNRVVCHKCGAVKAE